jgi:hypothetical protein
MPWRLVGVIVIALAAAAGSRWWAIHRASPSAAVVVPQTFPELDAYFNAMDRMPGDVSVGMTLDEYKAKIRDLDYLALVLTRTGRPYNKWLASAHALYGLGLANWQSGRTELRDGCWKDAADAVEQARATKGR